MADSTLEQRVAALEQSLADLHQKLPITPVPTGKWWEQIAPSFSNDPVFEEMLAYGRYFRRTGHEAPLDWKPGDPIPEPADGDELP